MNSLSQVEELTRRYALAHKRSTAILTALNEEAERIQRSARRRFKRIYKIEAARLAELAEAINNSRGLFKSPRTVVFHGIKVGLQKGKGTIKISKEEFDRVVTLIKKHFPKQVETLIITKEMPSVKNLSDLKGDELKKLGLSITGAGDNVLISPTDSAVDKLFKAYLKETLKDMDIDV
jgi:hypothetical protein